MAEGGVRKRGSSPKYGKKFPSSSSFSGRQSSLFSARTNESNVTSSPEGSQSSQVDILPDDESTPVGGLTRFWRSISGLWKTTVIEEMDQEEDEEAYIAVLLREFATYVPFLICLCVMAFCMLSDNMFWLTKAMQGLFVDAPELPEIKNTVQFWEYMEGAFLEALHKEKNYDKTAVHHTQLGYILFENKLLGRARLRQVRVHNKSCTIPELMEGYIDACYGYYSRENEEKITYWSGEIHSGWAYQTEEELEGFPVVGTLSTYGGGGFVQELADNRDLSTAIVGYLKKRLWVDRGTRAVIVDFTVYNANVNIFSLVKLIFEFPPTGGVMSMFRFQAQKLLRYVTTLDYFVMACEGIIILYVIYYIIEEIVEFRVQKSAYFVEAWTFIDVGLIALSAACIIMNIFRTLKVNIQLENILKNRDTYGNFEILSTVQDKFNDLVAVTMFVAWFKVFKYLGFNHTMAELKGTLKTCMMDIMGFTVMFVIVFFSFAISGVAAFGPQLEEFKNFSMANFTLFRVLLGDFDFDSLAAAAPTMGPIYFLLYIFAFVFLLLNMFMAIFFDTYAEVKEELDEIEDKFDITEYMAKGMDKVKMKLALQQTKIEDIRYALKEADINQDDVIDFDEWRVVMKMRGHSTAEAEAVFAKYDLDGDGVLNKKEQNKVIMELEEEEDDMVEEMDSLAHVKKQQDALMSKIYLRNEDGEESESEASQASEEDDRSSGTDTEKLVEYPEFTIVQNRVDKCEDRVKEIINKMDSVLCKLEDMDKAKKERRETMDSYLRVISEYAEPGEAFEWFHEEGVESQVASSRVSRASTRISLAAMMSNVALTAQAETLTEEPTQTEI